MFLREFVLVPIDLTLAWFVDFGCFLLHGEIDVLGYLSAIYGFDVQDEFH
jgi:hypothetical protein